MRENGVPLWLNIMEKAEKGLKGCLRSAVVVQL